MLRKQKIDIELNSITWQLQNDRYCKPIDEKYFIEKLPEAGVRFAIQGDPFKQKASRWYGETESINIGKYHYISLLYKAEGLSREKPLQPLLSICKNGSSGKGDEIPLLYMTNIIADGCIHRLVVKKNVILDKDVFVVDIASKDTFGYIEIKSLELIENVDGLNDCIAYETTERNTDGIYSYVDFENQYNESYDKLLYRALDRAEITPLKKKVGDPVITDGGRYFQEEYIKVEGIPFHVKIDGLNIVSPPRESEINNEIVEYFGLKAKRGLVAPISRDDLIGIEINAHANEVYFLMMAELPATCQFKFIITDAAVEGQIFDEIRVPFSATDVECFVVELIYSDGTSSLAFPFSLKEKRHVIQGSFGVYSVQADSEKLLKNIIFHNRIRGYNFHIAAVTVKYDSNGLLNDNSNHSSLVKEKDFIIPRLPFADISGSMIYIGNSYMSMDLDISNGLTITRLENRWIGPDDLKIKPASALCINEHDRSTNAELSLVSVKKYTEEANFKIELLFSTLVNGAALELKVDITVSDKPEIGLQLTVINKSDINVDIDIMFPVIKGLVFSSSEDTWYMFPKYRNVISNGRGNFCSKSAPTFPMQFFDIYNPVMNAGCFIMTKDLKYIIKNYALAKKEYGVDCHIQYPENYTNIMPGGSFECPECVIGVHKGDWHTAAEYYRQWLKTWYRPFKSQNKQWYRECFWMIAEITDTLETEIFKLPVWYDEVQKQYKMRDIIEEHRRVAGRYPDILHFWSWCYSNEEKNQIYGGYGKKDYDRLGGIKSFRKSLDDIQNNLNVPVSLYMNATLCHKSYPIAEELGLEGCMRTKDGELSMVEGTNYRMCHSFKKWRDYMVETYKRVYNETGAKILYVDEFSLLEDNTCYSKEHGHKAPLNLIEADNGFIKAVRSVLPEEVVLYSEFPPVDVNSQFIDCNINYYNVDMVIEMIDSFCDFKIDDTFTSPVLIDLYRFMFPGIVQLNLPIGIRNGSWHPLKFTFFNGEAIYDSFWDIEESRAHDFVLKAYDIKKAYADCFTTDYPEILVPTESGDICANKFPGKDRTLWTLYNKAYCTRRGELLSVQHTEGAIYYDAWNGKRMDVRIYGGKAYLNLEIDPQSVGCIVKEDIDKL